MFGRWLDRNERLFALPVRWVGAGRLLHLGRDWIHLGGLDRGDCFLGAAMAPKKQQKLIAPMVTPAEIAAAKALLEDAVAKKRAYSSMRTYLEATGTLKDYPNTKRPQSPKRNIESFRISLLPLPLPTGRDAGAVLLQVRGVRPEGYGRRGAGGGLDQGRRPVRWRTWVSRNTGGVCWLRGSRFVPGLHWALVRPASAGVGV